MSGTNLIRPLVLAAVCAATALPVGGGADAQPGGRVSPAIRQLTPAQVATLPMSQLRATTPYTPESVAKSRVDPDRGYQGQRGCLGGDRPGAIALRNLLQRTYSTGVPIGLSRGCRGGTSEHYDGRALDWMVNAANRRQAALGDAFVEWATRSERGVPGANARRLGIMYLIWRGRMWRSYRPGWTDYQGCSRGGGDATRCHRNHVHISLNWAGAYKRTSWYTRR
jgi:hypothetical protein